jgi:hypothetical protein
MMSANGCAEWNDNVAALKAHSSQGNTIGGGMPEITLNASLVR